MGLSKKELGNLVKKARKLKSEKIGKRYTQQMLAQDINKSQSYIGDIEAGRTYPSFIVLNSIASACGVSLSYFQDENIINKDIDKFINLQLNNIDKENVHIIREEIKKDPDAKLNYIYDPLTKDTNLLKETADNFLDNLEEIIGFLINNTGLMTCLGLDINKMSNKEICDFSKDLICQLNLVSYKYKK
ncbi:helix-turn-helix transcriptional regulator [Clostridium sporogenes]|uniref:helix-turn-helix domain-containing protein n=1 Tax=Clostridium sporogenes TaxID=1509 RepID=UPI0013D018A0|nr:helix-turn-helix transcriptional regulator [Clostridium sporogenes]NFV11673.1 helix-turn-helix transcriptional regulator [Clostridium sporogenes]